MEGFDTEKIAEMISKNTYGWAKAFAALLREGKTGKLSVHPLDEKVLNHASADARFYESSESCYAFTLYYGFTFDSSLATSKRLKQDVKFSCCWSDICDTSVRGFPVAILNFGKSRSTGLPMPAFDKDSGRWDIYDEDTCAFLRSKWEAQSTSTLESFINTASSVLAESTLDELTKKFDGPEMEKIRKQAKIAETTAAWRLFPNDCFSCS